MREKRGYCKLGDNVFLIAGGGSCQVIDEILRELIYCVIVVVVLGIRWDSSGWDLGILGIGILGSR